MARISYYPDASAIAKSFDIKKEDALDIAAAAKSSLFFSDLSKWKSKEKSKGTPHGHIEAAAERMASCWFETNPELDLSGLSLRSLPACLSEVHGLKIRDERGVRPAAAIRDLTGTSITQGRIKPVPPPRSERRRLKELSASLKKSENVATSQSSDDMRPMGTSIAQGKEKPVRPPRSERRRLADSSASPKKPEEIATSQSSGDMRADPAAGPHSENASIPYPSIPPRTASLVKRHMLNGAPKENDQSVSRSARIEQQQDKNEETTSVGTQPAPITQSAAQPSFAEGRSRHFLGKHRELMERGLKGKEARAYVRENGRFRDLFSETARQTGKGVLKALRGRKSDPAGGTLKRGAMTMAPEAGNDAISLSAATNIDGRRRGNPDKLPESVSSSFTPETRLREEESGVASSSRIGNPISANPLLVLKEHERIYDQRKVYGAQNIDIDAVAHRLNGVSHQKKGISGAGNNCWWRAMWLATIFQHRKAPERLEKNILAVLGSGCNTGEEIAEVRGQWKDSCQMIREMAEAVNTNIEQILTTVSPSEDIMSADSRLRFPGAENPEECEARLQHLTARLALAIGFEWDPPNPANSLDIISVKESVLGDAMGQDNQILPLMYRLGADGVVYNKSAQVQVPGKKAWTRPSQISTCPVDPDSFPEPGDGTKRETCTGNLIDSLEALPVIRHEGAHFTVYLPKKEHPGEEHEGAREAGEGSVPVKNQSGSKPSRVGSRSRPY